MVPDVELIHIVLCIYDPKGTYARHAAVVMASIFMNTHSLINIHIIHDCTLTDENRMRLQKTANNFRQYIDFVNIQQSRDVMFRYRCNNCTLFSWMSI